MAKKKRNPEKRKQSISISGPLHDLALGKMNDDGWQSFSAVVEALVASWVLQVKPQKCK